MFIVVGAPYADLRVALHPASCLCLVDGGKKKQCARSVPSVPAVYISVHDMCPAALVFFFIFPSSVGNCAVSCVVLRVTCSLLYY